MDVASSSQIKYTSFAQACEEGTLLDTTGGGPMEGPAVFGPDAYICELAIDAEPTKEKLHYQIF